jgi:diguanylate cyclase (GGDEF)-like protein/PAS domain S-box-containing protein
MVSKNATFGAGRIAPELREWVENRLVTAHVRGVRATVLGTLLNTLVLAVCLARDLPWWGVALLVLLLGASSAHRLWLSRRRNRFTTAGMITAFQVNSACLGIGLGTFCAQTFATLSTGSQLVLAVSAITQIGAASYTIRTLPRAALLFIAPTSVGLALGFVTSLTFDAIGSAVLLLAASALLMRMVLDAHDMFVARILRERELRATTRTVQLLLNEFEESGSDWLFELDGEGRMHRVSGRFAQAAGRAAEELNGRPFVELFDPSSGRETIAAALAGRKPVRDAVVTLGQADGGTSWWSVSGRPAYASTLDRVAFRGAISDITHQKQAESRVRHMAHYDGLTGLPNRSLFNSVLTQMLDDRGSDERVALMLIDVDHFKAVNDMYGHPVGDGFLRQVAERMRHAVIDSGLGGEQSLVARLGGDEFAILLGGEDAADHAVRLAEVLREAMAGTFSVEANELDTSISVGIALAPDHAELVGQLQVNADIALYAAKGFGRNRWEMFEPGMDQQLHERHSLARDLRQAVSKGELRLFLQPLIDIESEEKTGYEALLRWEHPSRGMIAPDQFIPLAEETGLIVGIGEWVIRTAFAQAVQWPGAETIAINLSPIQLSSPNLLPVVVNALAETGLDPARVEFEITESVLLHNSAVNVQALNQLHALGVKIALDDFGTGYASLNYLLTFPFDKIKIDRSFISDLENREESRAIVGAVIGLANSLGMCTLAEGVEDEAQLAELRGHGCRMVQGWLFGKAMPAEHYHPAMMVVPNGADLARIGPAKRKASAARRPRRPRAASA